MSTSNVVAITGKSPSIRREWIEIHISNKMCSSYNSLPPYGGSGLKCLMLMHKTSYLVSPSIRWEWIEMLVVYPLIRGLFVSLHTEGVD